MWWFSFKLCFIYLYTSLTLAFIPRTFPFWLPASCSERILMPCIFGASGSLFKYVLFARALEWKVSSHLWYCNWCKAWEVHTVVFVWSGKYLTLSSKCYLFCSLKFWECVPAEEIISSVSLSRDRLNSTLVHLEANSPSLSLLEDI